MIKGITPEAKACLWNEALRRLPENDVGELLRLREGRANAAGWAQAPACNGPRKGEIDAFAGALYNGEGFFSTDASYGSARNRLSSAIDGKFLKNLTPEEKNYLWDKALQRLKPGDVKAFLRSRRDAADRAQRGEWRAPAYNLDHKRKAAIDGEFERLNAESGLHWGTPSGRIYSALKGSMIGPMSQDEQRYALDKTFERWATGRGGGLRDINRLGALCLRNPELQGMFEERFVANTAVDGPLSGMRLAADYSHGIGNIGAAAWGEAFPRPANVFPGAGGFDLHISVKILTNMTEGQYPFKPELGEVGPVTWFVTAGNPYTGRSKPVVIPAEIKNPAGKPVLVFGEKELIAIRNSKLPEALVKAEQQWREKKNESDPINSRARKDIKNNAMKIAESEMWKEVGERVGKFESGMGWVILQNSEFSRSGQAMVKRPDND